MQSWCRISATQWIQAYPCKNKNFSGNTKKLAKVPGTRIGSLESFNTDNSLEFGKACEDLSWNHCTSTPHRSETNGIAERAVRRVKEGTSAVLLQSDLDENWWADSMECYTCLRNVQDLLSDGKTPYERRIGEPFKSTNFSIWCTGGILFLLREKQCEDSSIRKESLTRNLSRTCFVRGWEFGKKIFLMAEIEELEKLDASEIYPRRLSAKEVLITHKDGEFVFPVADGSAKSSGRDYEFQEPTLRRDPTVRRENLSGEPHGDREEFQLEETKDDEESQKDFWSMFKCDFIYLDHIEPRVQLFMREKNHSLFH